MNELTEGERLARRRKRIKGLSQGKLARLAKVSTGTVLRLEKDRNTQADHKAQIIAALEKEERKRGLVTGPVIAPGSTSIHVEPDGDSRRRYEQLRAVERSARLLLNQLHEILDDEIRDIANHERRQTDHKIVS